ncbi:MAG: aminoglycoside phosphotransferase family protein [Gammaproteobacteria bacterium]|nr:aminoglycoside phosphotransferase family protein [Gammaproteobacteria bacterium]
MISNSILAQWGLSGPQARLGNGLINDTFCVDNRFVLQRINKQVFDHPQRLVTNFKNVHDHVLDLVPRLLPTVGGEDCYEDSDGDVWRCSVYYRSRNFQSLPDELVYAAGQAFGLFLFRLRDCTVPLEPAIPNFHDFEYYLNELEQVWLDDDEQPDRSLIDRCRETFNQRPVSGQRQIIHGDCKVNNLLFDLRSDKVVRIVDTDTLMWGSPVWDFGDLVRSVAMDIEQDDKLKKRLNSVCAGFFEQFPIPKAEAKCYAFAPIHMSMMLGIRFLTDHMLGNQYFKVERVGENMDRAKEQLMLVERFDTIQDALHTTILAYSETCSKIEV